MNKVNETEVELDLEPRSGITSRLLELEGECKVASVMPLKFSWIKTILLIFPIIASLVPLLLLKYFKRFRVMVFYSETTFADATYVFIENTQGVTDIEEVFRDEAGAFCFFKKLKYRIQKNKTVPVGFCFELVYDHYLNKSHAEKGLAQDTIQAHTELYGRNEHTVDIPNYFEYLFTVMTQPFFLLQYIICVIFILQKITVFAIVMLVFSFLTTSLNYILLFINFRKIKQMAEKETQVKVVRNGKVQEVSNLQLVPGDIYLPEKNQEVICDCLVIHGEAYVNEASLTGESIPIGKFKVASIAETNEDNRWLYEGSKLLEVRNSTKALVINTGYTTRRGRIIRKILTRVTKDPDFFMTAIYFLFESFIIGVIVYLATLPILLAADITPAFKGFRFLDFLGWSFPPTFPIYFNLAYSFSLGRLGYKGIYGTQPEKTVVGANLKTMCFDKTGTLTQNAVNVHEIYKFLDADNYKEITSEASEQDNSFVMKLFSTCHTVKEIDGEFMGDQVDLRMFLFSNYQMKPSTDPSVKFIAEKDNEKIEVIRINQFESKFQNMSVLVKDCKSKKHYAFVKGAPERIDRNSVLKVHDYEKLVSNLSLGGYRTIGFGYREVQENEVQQYMEGNRDIYEKDITALGLVAFENKLKGDTRDTILKLVEGGIEPKMITGDNIFIAVETGARAGIVDRNQKIILLEGRKQNSTQGPNRVFRGILLTRHAHQTIQQPIELNENDEYMNQGHPMAVDNDFITMKPEPALPDTIKLFSRISPENKALIVNKYKERIEREYEERTWSQKFFGRGKPKVGMAGDGANDLMAIREADLGIGISDSDASYGASFTIVNMLDVDEIIRESKNASQIIVEMMRYYGTISWLKIPAAILLLSDTTYFSSDQLVYFNFAATIWFPVLIALSFPAKKITKYSPISNMMSLQNHLSYWGNIIIPTAGLCAGYFYFTNTPEFIANPTPTLTQVGYFTKTHSTTVVWLMAQIPFAFNALFLYSSSPFKQSLSRNYPMLLLIVLNIGADISFFFITKYMTSAFGFVEISVERGAILLAIAGLTTALAGLANYWVTSLELYKDDQPTESLQEE